MFAAKSCLPSWSKLDYWRWRRCDHWLLWTIPDISWRTVQFSNDPCAKWSWLVLVQLALSWGLTYVWSAYWTKLHLSWNAWRTIWELIEWSCIKDNWEFDSTEKTGTDRNRDAVKLLPNGTAVARRVRVDYSCLSLKTRWARHNCGVYSLHVTYWIWPTLWQSKDNATCY